MNDGTDWRETAGTGLCALLSLAIFVPLVVAAGHVPAALAVGIALVCPLAWLLFLWRTGTKGWGGRRPGAAWAAWLLLRPVPTSAPEANDDAS